MPRGLKRKRSAYSNVARSYSTKKRFRRTPYAPRGFPGNNARITYGLKERKSIDVSTGAIAVNTTSSITLISGVATGTDFTDRVGRKIMMKSIQVRGRMSLDPTSTAGVPQLARMILVQDRNPNSGTAFVITDLLVASTPVSMLNLNNRDRFRILADKQYTFGFYNTTATQAIAMGNSIFPIKLYKKVNISATYSGTANTIGSIAENAIFLVFLSDVAAGVNDAAATVVTRIRFTDS